MNKSTSKLCTVIPRSYAIVGAGDERKLYSRTFIIRSVKYPDQFYRKQVFRRILLADYDEENVTAFAEKLNRKDACYMLAEAWDSLERLSMKNAWNKLWPDLEGEKNSNDDHWEEITDFVHSTPGFQECDEEDVDTRMAGDAKDCGFQMLNDDEIVTSVQEESYPVDDETDED
ncbi:UNVERIFIED_CONTAM: Jerky-like protein [Trichonephila clavipes]